MKQAFTVTVEGFAAGADVAGAIKSQLEVHNGTPSWRVTVEPLVSILLPTYNYGHRIGRMIASIRAQSVQDVELIVVDDGSEDDTIARVRPLLGPGDRLLLHGKNQGAAAAINTAAAHATGRFMTWVSSDNEMTPDWLEKLIELMTSTVGVAYANYDRFNDEGPQKGTWGKPYDPARLLNDENCYIGPAFLMRADVWRETGEHRGRTAHDYDHWLRTEETCMRRGLTFVYCPDVLCHYYAGRERSTVTRKREYDAPSWQSEARSRRGASAPASHHPSSVAS
jgi:glycosyltransferase involved in cell wall biosynthesis